MYLSMPEPSFVSHLDYFKLDVMFNQFCPKPEFSDLWESQIKYYHIGYQKILRWSTNKPLKAGKVQLFWEGHKNLESSSTCFDIYLVNQMEDNWEILLSFQKSWTLHLWSVHLRYVRMVCTPNMTNFFVNIFWRIYLTNFFDKYLLLIFRWMFWRFFWRFFWQMFLTNFKILLKNIMTVFLEYFFDL